MKDMSTKTFNSIVIMFLFKRQLQTINIIWQKRSA